MSDNGTRRYIVRTQGLCEGNAKWQAKFLGGKFIASIRLFTTVGRSR